MNSESQYKPSPHPDLEVQRIKREGKFSDEEARDIYARASEIQSQTVFDEGGLTDVEMERGANRAGLSDAALLQAIKERDEERKKAAETQKLRIAQKSILTRRAAMVSAVLVSLAGMNLLGAQHSLSARTVQVQTASAQIENVLERRHNLIPNLIAVTKSTLDNQNALIKNLSDASAAAKNASSNDEKTSAEAKLSESVSQTLAALHSEQGTSPIVLRLSDEMAGSENRIAVERRKYNQAAAEYNRAATGFPNGLARRVLGFPSSYPLFQASEGAKETPKF